MSYKVELTREEHELVLRETLKNWSLQDHDIQLLSTEGYRIISHKKILSFYSRQLKNLLNEPEIAFGSQIPTLSLPASSSCISSLLSLLVTGKAEKASLQEVRQLATAMGINLKNCLVEKKVGSFKPGGLTVVKLPFENDNIKANAKGLLSKKTLSKPIRVEPVLNKVSPGPLVDPIGSIKSFKDKLEKSGSGLRIELKGMENVKAAIKTENLNLGPATIMKKPKCVDCGIVFKDEQYLNKHRERKHGEPNNFQDVTENEDEKAADSTEDGDKKVKCDVCHKQLSRFSIDKHRYRKHGLRRKDRMRVKVEDDGIALDSNNCSICGKKFNSEDSLLKHMKKKHMKGYTCDECPKSFRAGSELRVHKRIHLPDSEKPYECDVCQKKFCQRGQRRIHMKKFHNIDVPLESQNLSKTDQTVSESSVLEADNTSIGEDVEQSQSLEESVVTPTDETFETTSHDNCGYCGEKFVNEEDLNNHIASVHS